jgi:hypothetical protein
MKTTAELVEIVFNLQMQQKAAWTQYLSSGYEQMAVNSRLYRDAADAINEFIDRENRDRENAKEATRMLNDPYGRWSTPRDPHS